MEEGDAYVERMSDRMQGDRRTEAGQNKTPRSWKDPYEAYADRTLPSFYPRNEQGDDVCGRFSRLFPEMVTETETFQTSTLTHVLDFNVFT